MISILRAAACGAACIAVPLGAQEVVRADSVVVTATRVERSSADVPASIDVIDADRLGEGQPQVNLSESLPSLAGVVANNRQNYAQDVQVSIRGFGARSTFGVRGVRVIVDGIPATLPDGQAQVSHIDLASTGRIEVLRGPFSVLYGNAAGGVVNVFTRAPASPSKVEATLARGSFDTWRATGVASGRSGAFGYTLSAGRFETGGYREHGKAVRTNGNALLRWDPGARTSLVLVANAVDMPGTQDPLGLTREQFENAPRSVVPAAITFDTRKSVDQAQAGGVLDHAIDGSNAVRVTLYGGNRATQQFQSIPVAVQASPLHPGGVIDLERAYSGVDARWTWNANLGGGPFTFVAGASLDRLAEDRRGFQNFSGNTLGLQGALRRDETNRVDERGVFAQAEWDPAPAWRLLGGVRASRVEFRSRDHYVTGANPDDSGEVGYSATTPVAGVTFRATSRLNAYAAAGRGFETPTTNELAYRTGGASGPNLDLRASRSDNVEAGLKWTDPGGWRATVALFRIDTKDEIVVDTNAGGRSTFRNAGGTRREGVELQADGRAGPLDVAVAYSTLRARYRDTFAGNHIPGIPARSLFVDLRWRLAPRWDVGVEARHAGRVYVDDANSDTAAGYTIAALRAATEWRVGATTLRAFVRVDNVFDRRYAGSVIVNEGNGRFFEPAAGRAWFAGVRLAL